ncbi:MAG: hypothetical protein IKI97_14640 [Clostridia bacterium]|nr:hypothetical protein [Clostridia bacterium]
MTEFFLNVVNMSISASWLVCAVLLLRLLLKKAPKWINVLLWGIVAVRLICPFSFESVLSLIPSSQTINPEIALNAPVIDSGVTIIDNVINPIIGEATISLQPEKDVNLFQFIMPYLAGVWLVGIAALLIYTLISFLRLKRKIGTAVLLRDNIYQSEAVVSPFVLGIIKPKIYLPFNMNGQDMDHVIAHEQAHIRRRDHWWKPLGFAVLTLHWFNPMVWLGYILLCRDIELACDEKVVKELSNEQRADYSEALLACSVNRRMIAACPLAFGEVGVKDRIKSVLNYKKPAFWVIVVAIVVSITVAVCFLTNPISDRLANIEGGKLDAYLTEQTAVMISDGETHKYVGAVKDDMLKKLFDIKISRKEVSLSRDEERDKTNTLILNMLTEESDILISFVGGIYVHFNADFSQVWVNDGVKPTYSYKVKNPESAKKIYNSIINLYLSDVGGVDDPSNVIVNTTINGLKVKYPQFFNVSTDGGLTVYIWQMSANNYSCYLANTSTEAISDNSFAYDVGASIAEMRAILSTYDVEQKDITVQPVINPFSSYVYNIDTAYRTKVKELFWKDSSNVDVSNNSQSATKTKSIERIVDHSVDDGVSYDNAFELFYTDDKYNYYFSNIISQYIIVEFDDGTKNNVKDALTAGEITISDLDKFEIQYSKTEKSVQPGANPYFNAEVLEVTEKNILVKPDDDSKETKSADKIYVSLDVISEIPVPTINTGDRVRVIYNGEIAETYPAQINNVFVIYLLGENDMVLSPTPLQ